MKRLPLVLVIAAAFATITACGGGSVSTTPVSTGASVSQSFNSAGYSGSLALTNVTAGANATETLIASAAAPSGVPVAASAARTALSSPPESVLLYLEATFSATVTAAGGTLSVTAPSGALSTSSGYELALYDPSAASPAWNDAFAGPASVAGNELTFALPAPVTFAGGLTYTLAIYPITSPSPSPSPSPSSSPTAAPAGELSVNPTTVNFTQAGVPQTVQVQEVGYTGTFTETNTCGGTTPAVLLGATTGPGPTWNESITGNNGGTCAVTFSDSSGQNLTTNITVTLSGFVVQSVGRNR